jgi:transposase
MKYLYIGVDCHKYKHVATLKNCFNEKIITISFHNDKKGFEYLVKTVNEHKSDLIPIYGLEDTKHLGYELASYLLSRDQLVKNVNSNLTYVERKKNPVIIKNDEFDSECIAKILLDEFDKLPNAESDEIYWTLKQLVKMRKVIVNNNIELKNKLHSQLTHHYPNYNQIFVNIDCMTALNLWETYPSPKQILEEDFDTLVTNLKTWSKNKMGIAKANKILEVINNNDTNYQVYQEERNTIIKMLVKQIKDNNKRLEEIEKEILDVYDKIGCQLHTYPCLEKITGACLLSEIGNINRFKDSGKLAKYAGIAPIEKSSGGTEKQLKNEFGNRELNSMFYKLACRSICAGRTGNTPTNPIFKEFYQKKINEGKTKHQALICIMRRTCNIIYGMLRNETEYIPPKQLVEQCKNSFRERKQLEEEKLKKKLEKKKKHSRNTG